MTNQLQKIAVEAMTKAELCERLLRENLSWVQTVKDEKPDKTIRTYVNIDVDFTAGEMTEVARKIGMLPPAYDPQMIGFKDEAEANEFREWQKARDAANAPKTEPKVNSGVQDDEIERESCPECSDGKLHVQPGGGVKCDKCAYWFCY